MTDFSIRCPRCGGPISPILEWTHWNDRVCEGFECDGDCAGTWDRQGNVKWKGFSNASPSS